MTDAERKSGELAAAAMTAYMRGRVRPGVLERVGKSLATTPMTDAEYRECLEVSWARTTDWPTVVWTIDERNKAWDRRRS